MNRYSAVLFLDSYTPGSIRLSTVYVLAAKAARRLRSPTIPAATGIARSARPAPRDAG